MAIDLNKKRTYRLVYFLPEPEDGERICVGLLFRDQGQYSLAYDSSFPKLSCVAPHYGKAALKFYLDELEQALRRASPEEVDLIVKKSGPQIVASDARVLLVPLTNAIKQKLLERFVLGRHAQEVAQVMKEEAQSREHPVEESIADFIRDFLPANRPDVIFHAKSRQVIGKSLPNVSTVAASIRLPGRIVVIDGVDLKIATARQVINRVNRVTHTFWEYGRAERERSLSGNDSLQRVALVLNGRPQYSAAQRDAHDFALHQFENESDLLVTDRAEQGQKLRSLLAGGN
jgi:hypothetical protein